MLTRTLRAGIRRKAEPGLARTPDCSGLAAAATVGAVRQTGFGGLHQRSPGFSACRRDQRATVDGKP
jgi:hypothetical protein